MIGKSYLLLSMLLAGLVIGCGGVAASDDAAQGAAIKMHATPGDAVLKRQYYAPFGEAPWPDRLTPEESGKAEKIRLLWSYGASAGVVLAFERIVFSDSPGKSSTFLRAKVISPLGENLLADEPRASKREQDITHYWFEITEEAFQNVASLFFSEQFEARPYRHFKTYADGRRVICVGRGSSYWLETYRDAAQWQIYRDSCNLSYKEDQKFIAALYEAVRTRSPELAELLEKNTPHKDN